MKANGNLSDASLERLQSAGPSPGFRSRGAKITTRGHILKLQCWMYAATGGPNVKWGGGHHCPPAGDEPGNQHKSRDEPEWRCSHWVNL